MISEKKIKEFVYNETNKKIGKKAIRKINKILEDQLKILLKKAKRSADFAGRILIKENDFVKT